MRLYGLLGRSRIQRPSPGPSSSAATKVGEEEPGDKVRNHNEPVIIGFLKEIVPFFKTIN